MRLFDLIDRDALESAIAAKHVKVQYHRTEPLAILNYTQTCMWERAWTPTTRQCRGLIYRTDTKEIVARPFAKFFNYGEPEAGDLDLFAPVVVTDKLDGSLGILYREPVSGQWSIATRGSFHSEQADHATALYRDVYDGKWTPTDGTTFLFEIIYPKNRIVLLYGEDDLYLIAAIDNNSGLNVLSTWPFAVPSYFEHRCLAEAMASPPRPNAEGLVVYFPESGQRVKLKQADYVALHRVMSNTSRRRLWEYLAVQACKGYIDGPKRWADKLGIDPARAESILAAGEDWQEKMLAGVPDEFFAWCRREIDWVLREVELVRAEVIGLRGRVPAGLARKEMAEIVRSMPHRSAVFDLIDGKQIETFCWRTAEPLPGAAWLNRSEDVA